MKRVFALLIILIAIGVSTTVSAQVTWGGSTTLGPIMQSAIETFSKTKGTPKISYELIGSSAGVTALLRGQYKLAGSSADLTKDQLAQGAYATAIGLDGITVVVHGDVDIASVSKADLAKIFHGVITNWNMLGGSKQPIVVVNRDESSGTYASFFDIFLKSSYPDKSTAFVRNAIVTRENGEVAAKVSSTPGAIGYVGMGFAPEVLNAGGIEMAVDGVEPTVANVIAGKYPGARTLYIVTKGKPVSGSLEANFIAFLLSPQGQAIVKSVDFIPLPKK